MKKLSKINPPVLWFWVFVVALLGLSFLFAPTAKLLNLHEIRFTTTSSSILYFKNIRSYFYEVDADRKPLLVYRLKSRTSSTVERPLDFSIVSNPLSNEAYIYLETNSKFKQSLKPSVFMVKENSDTLLYADVTKMNNEQHFDMAASIYLSLLSDEDIYLTTSERSRIKLFEDDHSRQNAEIVLEDYFKLVNKL